MGNALLQPLSPSWFVPEDRHGRQAQSAGPGTPPSHEEDLGAQAGARRWDMGYPAYLSTSIGILKNT